MDKASESNTEDSTSALGCQEQLSTDVLIGQGVPSSTLPGSSVPAEACQNSVADGAAFASKWSRGLLLTGQPGRGGVSFCPGGSETGGGGGRPGYLESHDNVSVGTSSDQEIRDDYVKPCPGYWLLGFCENGHRFAKELYCGREWCPICGEEWSPAHQRRFARWVLKATQIRTMGYFVFTLPPELRSKYRTRKALSILGHQVQELLKSYGYSRGLRRWHWFGDIARAGLKGVPVFHPHLNCLVDGGYLAPGKLDLIKAAYAGMIGSQVVDVNYRYRRSPGQMVHTLKYVTRSTFRDLEWDVDMAGQISGTRGSPGLRNQVTWGRGLWDQEPAWSMDDLQGPAREDIGELDPRAVEDLESGKCPRCGLPITWSETLPIEYLEAVESRPLGGGYRELPRVRPPPGLPAAVKKKLYFLELLHRVEVRMATARFEREAKAEAEGYQSWWHSLLNRRGGSYGH